MDEAQHQLAALVLDLHHQLPPRAELHLALRHLALHQHRLAVRRLGDRVEVGLVLVTQRQVQHQIEATADAELFQFLGGGRCGQRRLAGDIGRRVHGGIVPMQNGTAQAVPSIAAARGRAGRGGWLTGVPRSGYGPAAPCR
ncbi:hypothetical protein D3C78_1480260 [compost metagenome]